MHYYQFNIGDYRKDTAHLTLLEHGVYRMLIDSYYENEGPLKADDARLMRTHCIRSTEEQQAYRNVIADFFEEDDGYYRHEGCDKVLERIYEKSEKARAAAKERWGRENRKLGAGKEKDNADALRTHSEGSADGMPPITHNPIPTKDAPRKRGPILLTTYLEEQKTKNEKPLPPDSAVFQYQEESGLPTDYLLLAWREFKDRQIENRKKYKDWPRAFLNCVRANWYKLWWVDNDGTFHLTSTGKQAENKHGVVRDG